MLNIFLDNYKVKCIKKTNDNLLNKNEAYILNRFPIYVINLKTDVIRRSYIEHLFKKHHINYHLVIVEKFNYTSKNIGLINTINSSILGCALSHLWCIRDAISKNMKQFIIFEDDIIFHKNFQELFQPMLLALEYCDLLMMGALDRNLPENMDLNTDKVYFPKCNVLGAHANVYKLEFAKAFFNYKIHTETVMEFDTEYDKFMDKYKIGVCLPNLVVCELSTTNIHHYYSPLMRNNYNNFTKTFHTQYNYNEYEYMLIKFIQLISENSNNTSYTSFNDMVSAFCKNKEGYMEKIREWLLNSTYTLDDIIKICGYITNDKLVNDKVFVNSV